MRTILSLFVICISYPAIFGQGTVVFSENFQSGIPAGFLQLNLDQNLPNAQTSEYTNAWITVTDPNNPNDTVAAATSFFASPDTANRWLITPAISLGAFGNYVQWNSKSQDASYPDTYLVLLSTTDSLTSSFTDTLAFVVGEYAEWTNREVNLTGQGYNNQTVYLAFVLRSYDAYKLYIDDIEVRSLDNTSLPEVQASELHAAPNPFHSSVTLLDKPDGVEVSLTDLQGKTLWRSHDATLQLEFLPSGVYVLHCQGYRPIRIQKL